ncbi:MAG TPA: hypothetical protein VF297_19825 [Pyrinomonadaceae bacterium]
MRNLAPVVALACLFAACSAPTTNTTTNTNTTTTTNSAANANNANTTASTTPPATKAGSLADPKSSIAYQFDLV